MTCVTSDGMAPRSLTSAKGTAFHTFIRKKLTRTVCYVHGDAHKNIETKAEVGSKVESRAIKFDGIEERSITPDPKIDGTT